MPFHYIIDDDDYLSDDFVTLSGWGVQYNSTNRNYNPSSKLKLHTLQVCTLQCIVGVKVRIMKMDFNTGGTWRRWVGQ